MSTLLWIGGALMALGGAVAGMVYWIRGVASDRVSLGQADAALQLERDRTAAMEYAAAVARTDAAREFDAKIAATATAAAAARLLSETTRGS